MELDYGVLVMILLHMLQFLLQKIVHEDILKIAKVKLILDQGRADKTQFCKFKGLDNTPLSQFISKCI